MYVHQIPGVDYWAPENTDYLIIHEIILVNDMQIFAFFCYPNYLEIEGEGRGALILEERGRWHRG